MPSNPPDLPTSCPPIPTERSGRPIRGRGRIVGVLVATAVAVLLVPLAATAGAVEQVPGEQAAARQDTPTTVVSDVGPTSECSPGHIVRRPDCGIPPESPTDPGGWLQVSLFFLICAAVLGIIVFVWRRSRVARDARRAAGHDPVDLARAAGQGVRRSTRSEPVAETSSNRPEASAGT